MTNEEMQYIVDTFINWNKYEAIIKIREVKKEWFEEEFIIFADEYMWEKVRNDIIIYFFKYS